MGAVNSIIKLLILVTVSATNDIRTENVLNSKNLSQMVKKSKRGRNPLPKGEKKEQVRFSIKKSIIKKYGRDNLLRPEIIEENN